MSLQEVVLLAVDADGSIEDTANLRLNDQPVDQLAVLGVLNGLQSREMITYSTLESERWVLTKEGNVIADEGSHEVKVFNAIPAGEEGISEQELKELVGEAEKFGKGAAFKNKWIKKSARGVARLVDHVVDVTRDNLLKVRNGAQLPDAKTLEDLKKRKLTEKQKTATYKVVKGPKFSLSIQQEATDITQDMIQSGEWSSTQFKKYNLGSNVAGIPPKGGCFHPLMKVREEFRQIFLELGYGYSWKKEEAEKLILRTHTTAVSSNMLYLLAQEKEFRPVKYFSIDRVFRNETMDATHLAEFNQVEGVVADRGLALGDLIGVLHNFFKKLGIEKLRFKPAYNPYTEPSMEIFSWHKGLNRWVEIGNSGMFRPEVLRPLGLPDDVSVIAWGISLERPTMIKYGYDDIRELLGHKVNIKMVQENPICRLDKKMGREG
ncbi:hypothetical protein HDU76_002805 [Blyttiomyces sp. JEL0837]|nr:hypothetical protein HDU76_002805 [Blyttiomyces sp. JEL0837]